jgi:hypothetical protein
MKYFAKLSLENVVLSVHKVSDSDAPDEATGIQFLTNLINWSSWKQCLKTEVKVGDTYDASKNAFISPQPFNSWVLNNQNIWEAPTPKPETENYTISGSDQTFVAEPNWNEDNQRWEKTKVLTIDPVTTQGQHWDGTNWIVS